MSPVSRVSIQPPRDLPPGIEHGTLEGWNARCRCGPCYSAKQVQRRANGKQTRAGRRGGSSAALGPDSIPYVYGNDWLATLRKLRDKAEPGSKLHRKICARIVEIEAGDVGVPSNFLVRAVPPPQQTIPRF